MSASAPDLVALRTLPARAAAQSLELVLISAAIPCQVVQASEGWHLVVAEPDAERAAEQLRNYEHENRAPPPQPPPLLYGPTSAGFGLAAALMLAFLVTGPSRASSSAVSSWVEHGAADAAAILAGEFWRSTTALTLHADLAHVLANAFSACFFATLLFRSLGPGLGMLLVLAAGTGGNLLNAWVRGPGHLSVGASTALFGAIGVLCGLQFVRRWRLTTRRRGAWLPLAAGLGLLAMLGTAGERTDVLAHLFGLVCGVPLGAITALALARPPSLLVQAILMLVAVATLWSAWALAFALR